MARVVQGLTFERTLASQGLTPQRRAITRFRANRPAMLGGVIVAAFALIAVMAPVLAPRDPIYMESGVRLTAPDQSYLLGTDEYGRDILSRLLFGAQIAFLAGFSSTAVAAVLGVPLGLIAGYYGGWRDRVIAGLIDVLFAFPAILLAIGLVAMMGPGLRNVVIAIAFIMMPHFARIVRAATLVVRSQQYVEAAQSVGASDVRLIRQHVLPNIFAPIMVQASLVFSYAILAEASLSFLGVGNQPPTPSWGLMLQGTYGYLEQTPTASLFPGLAITLVVLGFNMLGDGLRDFLDPMQR